MQDKKETELIMKKNMNTKTETKEATVAALLMQKNSVEAQIYAIEKGREDENSVILYEEVCNLLDKVGDFYPRDYYARSRVYSRIVGVKNIRLYSNEEELLIKVTSRIGYLLPDKITVRGVEYKISFMQSNRFRDGIDY